jgi:hypothetical protein
MKIDKALSLYTEKLNNYETIDLNYFKKEMDQEDYNEFLELIYFVNLLKSEKETRDFKKVFEKINKYKEEIENGKQNI